MGRCELSTRSKTSLLCDCRWPMSHHGQHSKPSRQTKRFWRVTPAIQNGILSGLRRKVDQSCGLQNPNEQIGKTAGNRNRQQPCPRHSFDNRPSQGAESLCRADAHDGCGNVMCRRHRNSHRRREANHRGRRGLSSESVNWLKANHLVTERFDDSPATACRSRSHTTAQRILIHIAI